jgi:uncharacterized phage protein (TIGR01671 family)
MNDRFKFRAYNKELRKMYEVNTICPYEDNYTKGGEVFLNGIQYNSFYFPEEVEVMQCTGLKDKNGKLIYEGDILGGIYHGYIEYCDECKCFQLKVKDYGCLACEGDLHWYEIVEAEEQNELEVIGNIYENKELLESEG